MANYKESVISGELSQYTRCNSITIQNSRGSDLSARNAQFSEEVIKTLPDGSELTEAGEGITAEFDPAEVIELRDPATWELTGSSVTVGELYAILASAYWHYALKRDGDA